MKKYFIYNKTQEGPFSIEELKQKDITVKTMIWFEGLESWQEAGTIDELRDIVIAMPPPFNETTTNSKTPHADPAHSSSTHLKPAKKVSRILFKSLVALSAIIGLFFIIMMWLLTTTNKANQTLPDALFLKNEAKGYIHRYDENWQISIEGRVVNTSSTKAYKDLVVEVHILSDTNTELATMSNIIYKSIQPLDELYLNESWIANVPAGSSKITWKLISATEDAPATR